MFVEEINVEGVGIAKRVLAVRSLRVDIAKERSPRDYRYRDCRTAATSSDIPALLVVLNGTTNPDSGTRSVETLTPKEVLGLISCG